MKVLAINASPREGGNSDVLCSQFLKGASDAGHSVKKINLAKMDISPCTACYGCRNTNRCVKRDDMELVLQELINADVVVLATPVYFYSMDAQMKIMIDRCLPRYQEIKNKEFYYIITAADPEHTAADETIAGLRGYLRCLPRAKEKGIVYGTGTWDKGDVYKHPSYKKAYETGNALTGKNKCI
ncbi:NADPH-dependent FMN reductase [Clostridium sp. chh4-2]|uniref:flavodoxin family protein n=1 Tax=Clostridium sp. chh4-2 TaxID=2067550 RepID=UPI000CCECC83|nr:flavodoxin family protein [Clostridium sp. chh4-2]PNV63487.1 NADPH-dependent FMN reductase [Clostridium sp. chh4-2]